jgi:LacI family transcriptional regulator
MDVGRAAGVSAMAASAVLNGAKTSSRISDETRLRILEAATQLRYRPNATARALVQRRMNTIGVASSAWEGGPNSYALELVTGILEASGEYDQNATMFTLRNWDKDVERVHGWCDGRVDGIILLAPTLSREAYKLLPPHTPFVTVHGNQLVPHIVNVESDEERGAYELVTYLISLGHRRIMHVTGDRGLTGAERRIVGYKRALADARIPFSSKLVLPASFNSDKSRPVLREWMLRNEGEQLPQAMFCGNDGIATMVMETLAEAGLRVPDDVSVTGFDDTLAARTTAPQLTTMRQPLREMGRAAVEQLLKQVRRHETSNSPATDSNPIVFPVELVKRASVAPPPTAVRLVPKL